MNTVTTLLTEMDGFESLTGVLVLAATNRLGGFESVLTKPTGDDAWVPVGDLGDPGHRQALGDQRDQFLSLHPLPPDV